jgi:uncharacterized NAD(P)/FAD-binding protein YdhS
MAAVAPPVGVDVAIVGGGFAGAMTAVHLLGAGPAPLTVAVLDRRGLPGRGLAYNTPWPFHLLNVPAAEMSAYADDPLHFVRWCKDVDEQDFVARARYGEYLGAQVAAASEAAGPRRTCTWLHTDVLSLLPRDGGYRLTLATGETLDAKQVVLAIGQAPPAPFRVALGVAAQAGDAASPLYVADPWSAEALLPLHEEAEVLLVGTGLTAVDMALALCQLGARRVTLVSRRAKLSPPQFVGPAYPDWLDPLTAPLRISQLMRLFRREVNATQADWRSVIDAARPHLQAIWARLSWVERRRFLRHVRTPWEAHRNRLPPPTAAAFEARLSEGRVRVVSARLSGLTMGSGRLLATLTRAGGAQEDLCIDRAINCTGPDLFYRRGAQALVQTVIGTGLGRLEPLGLGFDVSEDFRLIDEDGASTPGLFAIGAPTKGRWWEVLAVRELRVQARELALIVASQA